MSYRLPESSSPATPERKQAHYNGEHPSTTPAGQPQPSPAPSFTPMGEPSPSYLTSSIGAMAGKIKAPNFGRPNIGGASKSRRTANVPLASSLRGSTTSRQPSGLGKHSYSVLDDLEDSDEDVDTAAPASQPGTFGMHFDSDDDEDEDEDQEDDIMGAQEDEEFDQEEEEEEDADGEDDDVDAMVEDEGNYDIEDDLVREMEATDYSGNFLGGGDTMDLLMGTPAANQRMQKEAGDIFRASSMRSLFGRRRDTKYSAVAKDLFSQLGHARISEPHSLILQTEEVIARLYDEGVGAEDDTDKLDMTLAGAADYLVRDVWEPHAKFLPKSNEEHGATIGPGPNSTAFEKASWIAAMVFQDQFGDFQPVTLPQTLFEWQQEYHNPSDGQVDSILAHRPSPASHGLFWQAIYMSLIRGDIKAAIKLLRNAGWNHVRKGTRGEPAYTGQPLRNIEKVIEDACHIMELCPAVADSNWDIQESNWTLFRLKATAAKESLVQFAEGKDQPQPSSGRFAGSDFGDSGDGHGAMARLARKAQSRLPWDVYESLQSLYSILVGDVDAITAGAQDWCEATIGLFGWWDDGHHNRRLGLSRSQSIMGEPSMKDDALDRLAHCFHAAMESDFHFNGLDAVEVCISSVFEGNIDGVVGFLSAWSLPVASSVAEVASLGRWLPPPEPQNLISMDNFDADDLEVLGMNQGMASGNQDGVKDSTLVSYARGLNDIKQLTGSVKKRGGVVTRVTRVGWEMAVQIVGRMDSPERSEDLVNDLLHDILEKIEPDSHDTVYKIWALLNDLGMINFAEDTAEKYGDVLKKDTFRFGEMLWYYALAHRPGKIRDVLNGLMSISLAESTIYPPDSELDARLKSLLQERITTLEQFAKQDLEAAELLGKMLSGYATLRKFYELRDGNGKSTSVSLARRQQAATALTFVVASADDNIRGGLYDDTRDAVVSEDFILALLGEASVFVNQNPTVITLEQIDTLLKAVEDIETVGSRVYEAADAFFQIVLSSGQGKGSTPGDLMKMSNSSLGGSFVMTGSSMMASQLHKSIRNSGVLKGPIKRSWDWRTEVLAASSSADILKTIRLGLTKDLANLWLEQADSIIL
ncbi:nuclear pore complex subunit Nup85 [Apiospora phragmitis]|uniref:Nuclear pore complex subunit Nup85 n=1 Tax=Apiospora phragmitis TaxID=2905665 RepID=A0ABR1TS22_9PEZI